VAENRDKYLALANTRMKLSRPLNAGNFFSHCSTVGFSRRTLVKGVS
jgi:hypothetical protein